MLVESPVLVGMNEVGSVLDGLTEYNFKTKSISWHTPTMQVVHCRLCPPLAINLFLQVDLDAMREDTGLEYGAANEMLHRHYRALQVL